MKKQIVSACMFMCCSLEIFAQTVGVPELGKGESNDSNKTTSPPAPVPSVIGGWRSPIPHSYFTLESRRLDLLFATGCQPFAANGVEYDGCPGDAPPPLMDAFLYAKAKGFKGSRSELLAECKISPQSCIVDPIPHDCPAGTLWSHAGGLPHCVREDPICLNGYVLSHDMIGNPFCTPERS